MSARIVSYGGPPKESLSDQTRSGDVATGPSAVFCPLRPARRRRSHPARTATQVAARSAKIRCASPPTALSPRMIAATMATAIATPNHVDVRLSRAHCGDLRKHLATTNGATAATSSRPPRIEWTVACHDLTVSSTVHPSATRQSKRKAGESKFPRPRGRTNSVVARVRPRVPHSRTEPRHTEDDRAGTGDALRYQEDPRVRRSERAHIADVMPGHGVCVALEHTSHEPAQREENLTCHASDPCSQHRALGTGHATHDAPSPPPRPH